MQNTICALSIACVCAGAHIVFADDEAPDYHQWQNDWFKSIGSDASSLTAMDATHGTWKFPVAGASFGSGKLVLDLEDGDSAVFNITSGVAEDTNTVTRITGSAKFYPAANVDELGTPVGKFALGAVGTKYYVWNGSAWSELADSVVSDSAVAFTAEIDYKKETGNLKVTIGDYNGTFTIGKNAIEGFTAKGCGEISSIDGAIQLAVAVVNGIRYGTVAEALAGVEGAVGDTPTISIVRETEEPVVVPSGTEVKIEDNGNVKGGVTVPDNQPITIKPPIKQFTPDVGQPGQSGEYVLQSTVKGGNLAVELPMSNKEIVGDPTRGEDGKVTVTIQTAKSVLSGAMTSGGKTLSVVGDNEAKLRAFLNTYANAAYIAGNVDSGLIADALNATPTESNSNNLRLWQDYALGIKPTDPVAPVADPAGDDLATGIKLKIPTTIVPSGDYTITYKVGTSESTTGFVAPLATGTYDIKIIFE